MIVSFELPLPKDQVPQCTTCQRYSHTKKFCHLPATCVKCTSNHHTSNCPSKERRIVYSIYFVKKTIRPTIRAAAYTNKYKKKNSPNLGRNPRLMKQAPRKLAIKK
ncbi:unnamed protein product [Diabrotica balteata]|uniref:Uncharacterized protein n=1 Tax=Diabrotica balteata TaxID=107213 RepID=A0A9N9T315_DIABA|nr:unnamed protein product [Diabrotica balteata]